MDSLPCSDISQMSRVKPPTAFRFGNSSRSEWDNLHREKEHIMDNTARYAHMLWQLLAAINTQYKVTEAEREPGPRPTF